MKNKLKKLTIATAIALYGAGAFATPIINTSDSINVNVPSNANTTNWFYGANENDLYVAPPSRGKVIFNNFVPQNASFCTDLSRLRAVEQDSNSTLALLNYQINQLAIEQGEYEWELDEKGNVIFDADSRPIKKLDSEGNPIRTAFGLEIAEARAKKVEAKIEKDRLDKKLISQQKIEGVASLTKDTARDNLTSCKEDASDFDEDWKEFCEDEYDTYKEARTAHNEAKANRRATEFDLLNAEFEYSKTSTILTELSDSKASVQRRISDLSNDVEIQKNRLSTIYKEIKGLFGGQVNMSYRTEWDAVVAAFQNDNPNLNIRRVNISKAVLTAPMSYAFDQNSALGEFSGVAWSTLNIANNVAEGNFNTLPDGTLAPVGVPDSLHGWPITSKALLVCTSLMLVWFKKALLV